MKSVRLITHVTPTNAQCCAAVFIELQAKITRHYGDTKENLLLLLLFLLLTTAIELSLCGSSPYTSTDKYK